MNKKIIINIIIVLITLVIIFFAVKIPENNVSQIDNEQKPDVSMINYSFDPQVLTIHKGDTVVWTNQDPVPHQITGESFSSSLFSNGQSYSFVFNDIGTFNYHCSIHPAMTGTIVVQ